MTDSISDDPPPGRVIYWRHEGLRLSYDGAYLICDDLNPQTRQRWMISRGQLFMLGLRFSWAALRGGKQR
jgi:hypothetical protein